ncbi:TauD-domain-containing protein [Choiromyces venosus 120613-1]|uniref:TauD-domain-containing protein n=1 Tax=Choiromyces venosus 120613-1 TaxID=1336337 RepID=A0A3N4JFD4_9PEZI|nr:TauD-domain-containing protein [Choiromyces venosus 120613-1]
MTAAYKKLSPSFREYLERLTALHSGVEQAEESLKKGASGILRRKPVETIHPVIRIHPGTGGKAIFVNKAFTKYIIGLKVEESELLLLINTLMIGLLFPIFGYDKGDIRHHFRLTATGERPIPVPGKVSSEALA